MSTNILVLAAGNSNNENIPGDAPLCLSEFNGSSVLERIIDSTLPINASHYTFAVLKKVDDKFCLGQIVKLLVKDSKIRIVPEFTKGAACTALLAACTLNDQNSLLIISANELLDVDLVAVLEDFDRRELDAATITFKSIQPRYSYVRLDSDGQVVEAAQRRPISQHATTGLFWFRKTIDFLEGTKNMIRKNAQIDNCFYVAPVFNELILKQKKIGIVQIDSAKYFPLKTISQIKQFEFVGGSH